MSSSLVEYKIESGNEKLPLEQLVLKNMQKRAVEQKYMDSEGEEVGKGPTPAEDETEETEGPPIKKEVEGDKKLPEMNGDPAPVPKAPSPTVEGAGNPKPLDGYDFVEKNKFPLAILGLLGALLLMKK